MDQEEKEVKGISTIIIEFGDLKFFVQIDHSRNIGPSGSKLGFNGQMCAKISENIKFKFINLSGNIKFQTIIILLKVLYKILNRINIKLN